MDIDLTPTPELPPRLSQRLAEALLAELKKLGKERGEPFTLHRLKVHREGAGSVQRFTIDLEIR